MTMGATGVAQMYLWPSTAQVWNAWSETHREGNEPRRNMPRAGDCAGLFRGSRDHKREKRVALELGLEGWTEHPLCVASLAEVLLLGWVLRLRTKGSRRVGGSLRWEWSGKMKMSRAVLSLIVKDWPR